MNSEEIDNMKVHILNLISSLNESVVYLKEASKPIEPGCALGRLTRMEAIGEKGVNEAMLSSSKDRIIRLENALKRIESGSFGICIKCKSEIPSGRLEVVPEALICVSCAESTR